MDYRPKAMVESLELFTKNRLKLLCDEAESWMNNLEELEQWGIDAGPEEELWETGYPRRYRDIEASWEAAAARKDSQEPPETDQYTSILLRGHEEFRRLYEEQLQLITSGSFAQAVASAIKHMPLFESLVFYNGNAQDAQDDQVTNRKI
ncbi:hypothetical protein B0T21DRAFT_407829 [Apiosordaria backusii]|uniref:Uncharacterized protein n=1 Tax=Apiosordaria backusii TaxID=314023 RepID=A0AA40K3N8_9PEZI|nr:hypothetical protein B0T21DRAFT_407829 [Apiosordaria backusii]